MLSCPKFRGPNAQLSHVQCPVGIVNYLPVWLAPNLITLIGVFALVVAYVVTLSYLPSLEGKLQPQVCLRSPNCRLTRSDCIGHGYMPELHDMPTNAKGLHCA